MRHLQKRGRTIGEMAYRIISRGFATHYCQRDIKMKPYKNLIAKRKNKYNATKTEVDGIVFDSKKEATYYQGLKMVKKTGELINFYMQVPFRLPGKTKYILDFLEVWQNGKIRHVDCKGFLTPVFKIKKRQVEEIYNIKIEIV